MFKLYTHGMPVADPGFSRGGCANSQIGIILQLFCNFFPWRPSIDPPMHAASEVSKKIERLKEKKFFQVPPPEKIMMAFIILPTDC